MQLLADRTGPHGLKLHVSPHPIQLCLKDDHTCTKHPQPAQVPHTLKCPTRNAVDRVAGDSLRLESRGGRVDDRIGRGEAAKPVTDPICVASPDECCDSGLDDR
jgi:hypothetical protein